MALRYGHVRATEGFGEIGTVDKAESDNTGHHRVDINLRHAYGIRHAVERDLQTVENEQHQYQIGHTANQRGVAFKNQRQYPIT
ncbi:hypothetical protein D3C86_1723360 [compost metagenome]